MPPNQAGPPFHLPMLLASWSHPHGTRPCPSTRLASLTGICSAGGENPAELLRLLTSFSILQQLDQLLGSGKEGVSSFGSTQLRRSQTMAEFSDGFAGPHLSFSCQDLYVSPGSFVWVGFSTNLLNGAFINVSPPDSQAPWLTVLDKFCP